MIIIYPTLISAQTTPYEMIPTPEWSILNMLPIKFKVVIPDEEEDLDDEGEFEPIYSKKVLIELPDPALIVGGVASIYIDHPEVDYETKITGRNSTVNGASSFTTFAKTTLVITLIENNWLITEQYSSPAPQDN